MTNDQQIHTLLTAAYFGGYFISKLAEVGLIADPVNRQIILDSFPRIISDYGPSSELYSELLG